jgi:hypothetical protein
MGGRNDLLFYRGRDLFIVLNANMERARNEVDGIPENNFIHLNDDDIVEHVYSGREMVPIELHEDKKKMDYRETQVDVRHDFDRAIVDNSGPVMIPGIRITVSVPFTGDANLWQYKANSFTLNPPRGLIRAAGDNCSGYLDVVLECPSDRLDDPEKIKREIECILNNVRSCLVNVNRDVDKHNRSLRGHIRQCVTNRRTLLGKHEEIAKALNIPLRKKSNAPDPALLPIKRRLIKPLPSPQIPSVEPGIRDEDYEHILNVIRHEGRSFEATPATFLKHNEEELRDIIIAHLNGHYEGDASGETFRREGKTDIRIEFENRAAFVGECKVWHGQKQIIEAINQLLSYLTWRDCKTALIVFNRDNAGFSNLQSTIDNCVKEHPNFIKKLNNNQSGEWRILVRSGEDIDKTITLHVFLFNLYLGKKLK